MTIHVPPRTIGILGGGQLARMLALAGYPLGLRFVCLDPSPDAPAGDVADLIVGEYTDPQAMSRFVERIDVVTYEFENIPIACVEHIAASHPVHPHPAALRTAQDRLAEKECFVRCGLPVHPFAAPSSRQEFMQAVERLGLPCVVKTRRLGYDGKGQSVVRSLAQAADVWEELGRALLLVEAFVPFVSECSLIGVRSTAGEVRFYPWTANVHVGGILRTSIAPLTHVPEEWRLAAEATAATMMHDFGYVGVLAIEFFVTPTGLLTNEMAPRVHNSGHWTMDAGLTSQFENHIRAVAGLPLGSTTLRGCAGMVNIIGEAPTAHAALALSDRHRLHLYGKDPRPGRKLGHVNVFGTSLEDVLEDVRMASTLAGAKPERPCA